MPSPPLPAGLTLSLSLSLEHLSPQTMMPFLFFSVLPATPLESSLLRVGRTCPSFALYYDCSQEIQGAPAPTPFSLTHHL